ncbi:MAG: anaerobic ribonucleoside-triphosphate reductase activating protein [Candidatus Paceibacterota bacterium]|jgi:pyruvate formate lyase activating enzyme
MLFGGLQKTTLVDYPGKVAATVFTNGCNFRCPYCHNPELVLPSLNQIQPKLTEKEILDFLTEKNKFLEALCITGGEPTLNPDLKDFIKKVKALGYLVKLDTNGSSPEVLKDLIDSRLIDYVAMDIKAPPEKYNLFTLGNISIEKIQESIDILKKSKIDYEFRTTVAPILLDEEDILKIANWIKPAKAYLLQKFESTKVLSKDYEGLKGFSDDKLQNLVNKIKPFFSKCELR